MPPDSFWSIQLPDLINALILIATVAAIVYGPIKAVAIARSHERVEDAFRRKRVILADLMRTRKNYMHPDHVGALNLVQLEFAEHATVLTQFRRYIENLSDPLPAPGNDLDNFLIRRANFFVDLLFEIGVVMQFRLDRADLDRLAYVPYGWERDDDQMRQLRQAFLDLLNGRRPLSIVPFQGSGAQAPYNPFPPPPGT